MNNCIECPDFKSGDVCCTNPEVIKRASNNRVLLSYYYDKINYKIKLVEDMPIWCPRKERKLKEIEYTHQEEGKEYYKEPCPNCKGKLYILLIGYRCEICGKLWGEDYD